MVIITVGFLFGAELEDAVVVESMAKIQYVMHQNV
jgi:hypothetical protein